MSFHTVIAFPFDADATLGAVLGQTKTGEIISSPMEDVLLICASETDGVFLRCGLGLRPATKAALLVPVEDQGAVAAWLVQNGMTARCEWATLEHFEFFSAAALDRTVEVFSDIVGQEPYSLPLNLWPGIFRPNKRAD